MLNFRGRRENSNSNDQDQDRFRGSGLGRIIHAPSRGSFKSTPLWLLASIFYFLTGPILVLVVVSTYKGWHALIAATVIATLWFWLVVVNAVKRARRVYRRYHTIGSGRSWFMIKTLCAQRKRFIDAQLSVPPSNPKGRPLTPSIKSHGLHDLGIYCRAEILRGQTPQMFIDATERLENAFDAELEVRRVDQRHIDIIFLLRNPLAGIRNAGFGFESYALDDSDAESNREPSTTSEDEW